jgi:glycosyltransferase involved in cell wall biosynthesis
MEIQMDVELTIVMPCLNEAETLENCIRKAASFICKCGISGEIIVGDNGSTDGSQAIALRCGARVVDAPVRGYGAALYAAIVAARGRFCVMGDSDDSYDFSHLELFVEALRTGADLVMGNRFLGGIAPNAMPWKNRYIGNPLLSSIGRFFFGCPARDFHCGLRAFSKEAFQRMDLRTTGMEFASEMVIKATLMKMKIVEVPTTLSADGRSRPPHLRPYRDGWRHLRFMLLYSPNWLFLYPGLALMTVGFVVGAALFFHPISVQGVRFSVDTLIYCSTMIEVGFQSVLFMLLSRAFAIQEGLFPRPSKPRLLDRLFRLERGVVLGLALLAIGALLVGRAISIWSSANFGDLDVENVSRIVIVSALFLSLGFEMALSSFLLGMLRLNVRPGPSRLLKN